MKTVCWTSLLTLFPVAESFSRQAFFGSRSSVRSAAPPLSSIATRFDFSGNEDDLPERGQGRGISSSELRKMSEARRRRLQEEKERETRFLTGDELQQLRKQIFELRQELQEARRTGTSARVHELERTILKAQQLDAEFIYQVALERMEAAAQAGLHMEAEKYRQEAHNARTALPQFSLDGLWVGKYGENGFEMINVTYTGDTLVAYKVTGDKNVPKGEVSFEVDLSPSNAMSMLEPIELGEQAAEQWGNRFLQRFAGEGQVASRGFVNPQWMDGQLILVGQYFSFAWLPIGHQVFFGRPSAELTLKLLREAREQEGEDSANREFLRRCFEETEYLEDDLEVGDGLFNSNNQQDYYTNPGCFE
eukprot:scaffold2829_cov147-Amphora_coffeaeformis.AAC.2